MIDPKRNVPDNQPAHPNEVNTLTLDHTGICLAHTTQSIHRLDLDQKGAELISGEDAARYDVGAKVLKPRPSTSCAVGSPVYFVSDDRPHPVRRASTTPVIQIEREVVR